VTDYFLIAKIVSTAGRNGVVKIISYSDYDERFFQLNEIFVDFFEDKKSLKVESVEERKNCFFIKFKNFDSNLESEILIGKNIYVNENDLVKLPKNYFFIHDMIGSDVFCNDVKIGKVKDVLNLPANDVFVISDLDNNERLIPAVQDFVEKYDVNEKILILKKVDEYYEDDDED
jgi:16S rRNA processing protein RimM